MNHTATRPYLSERAKALKALPYYKDSTLDELERKGLIIRHFEFVSEANMSEETKPTMTEKGKRLARQLGAVIPG